LELEQKIQPSKVFCISNGWLQGFLGRYTIVSRVLWSSRRESLLKRLAQYKAEDISSMMMRLSYIFKFALKGRESLEFHYFFLKNGIN